MKKILKYILFVFLINLFIINLNAEELNLQSKNIVLYNLNDKNIIYEVNKDERISIASLTKIMTVLVAIENSDLNKEVIITEEVFEGTSGFALAGFKVGDKVTIKDLLYGAILPSGAEACNALAINIGGSFDKYIEKMNEKASELGLENTHFETITGADKENHYSSVEDVSKLLIYALKNKEFKTIYETKEYTTSNNLKFKSSLNSTAKRYNIDASYITGSKTGYTNKAGLCLSSTAYINKVNYLLVTCNAPSLYNIPYHIIDTNKIYKYYSENYDYVPIIKKGDVIKTLNVKNAKIKTYDLKQDKTIKKYLKKDSKIKVKYDGIEELNIKILKNDKLGKVTITADDKVIESYDIYLTEYIKYNIITSKNLIIFVSILVAFLLLFKFFKK